MRFLDIAQSPAGLAPLAGISDSSFREICRSLGAGFTVSEMVSAEGLVRRQKKTLALMRFNSAERPFGIQLFGRNQDILAEAVRIAAAEMAPDFIDLNCGCPARKVVRRGEGCALMNDLPQLEKVCRAMRGAVSIPLTVKFRTGLDSGQPIAVEAAKIAESCGFDAVTVHARSLKQGFTGRADWKHIAAVKEAVKIPVIGNGDIAAPEDAERMFQQTGCDLAMVGRGALGKPWIFAQIAGEIEEVPLSLRLETVKRHYGLTFADKGEYVGVREMRKHLGWYCKGMPGAAEFRRRVMTLEDPGKVMVEIEDFFNGGLKNNHN